MLLFSGKYFSPDVVAFFQPQQLSLAGKRWLCLASSLETAASVVVFRVAIGLDLQLSALRLMDSWKHSLLIFVHEKRLISATFVDEVKSGFARAARG